MPDSTNPLEIFQLHSEHKGNIVDPTLPLHMTSCLDLFLGKIVGSRCAVT